MSVHNKKKGWDEMQKRGQIAERTEIVKMGYKGNVARNCIGTGAQFKRKETKGKRGTERKRGKKGVEGKG